MWESCGDLNYGRVAIWWCGGVEISRVYDEGTAGRTGEVGLVWYGMVWCEVACSGVVCSM